MTTKLRTILTTGAVLAALAGASSLFAATDTSKERPQAGMMGGMMQGGQGDMAGMMNMMGQMSQMMESCNEMMKDMKQQRSPAPKEQHDMPGHKG